MRARRGIGSWWEPGDRSSPVKWSLLLAAGYGALAVVFWRWRILGGAPATGPIDAPTSDLYAQYIPVMSKAFADLSRGALPLWNPDQLAGVPTLPSWYTFGVFYPLNALHWTLPVHLALGWTTCLHLAVAGLAMHWLARTLDLAPAAACFAAVTFLLSRPFLFEPNLFNAMALAPAVVAAWMRLSDAPSPGRAAAAAAVTALQLSTGGSQMTTYTFYGAAILLLSSRPWALSAKWWRIAWSTAAAALALGLVAFALLPTLVHANLTYRRPGGLSLAESVPLPTPTVAELLRTLLAPAPGLPRLFFGWAALSLAALGLASASRRRLVVGLLAMTLLGALIVLGPNTPFYALYRALPTGDWFRVPQRAMLLPGFGISLLAGLGVDGLWRRGWRLTAAFSILLPAIELFHATWSTATHPQVRDASAVAPPAAVEAIREQLGGARAYIARNWGDRFPFIEKLGTWQSFPVAQDYEPLTPALYRDFLTAFLGRQALVGNSFTGRYHPLFDTPVARRAVDLLGVGVLVVAPGASANFEGQHQASAGGPLLLVNSRALPRAYLVHRVEAAGSAAVALERLTRPDFDPSAAAVVVDSRSLDLPDSPSDSLERLEIVEDNAADVSLRLHVERPALLVLGDVLLPGWTARVDGSPAPILLANGLFRGLHLEPGDHVVRFSYRSRAFRIGLWISATSFLLLIACAVLGARQRFVPRALPG